MTRSDKGQKHKHYHDDLQKLVVKSARRRRLPMFGTMNGMLLAGGAAAGKKAVDLGMESGVPDLFMFKRGKGGKIGLAIEIKIGRDKLSPNQAHWFEVLRLCSIR
jgi:hypothetical protein